MDTEEDKRKQRFLDAINRQGHSFQTRVLLETERLREAKQSPWNFESAEFPVEAGGQGTRIDFILSDLDRKAWLLAECKRVNPAYSDWLFLKTPYVRRNHTERYIAEHCRVDKAGNFRATGMCIRFPDPEMVFHTAFDVKTDKKGDASGAKSAVEEAASQICRGMNGMANYLKTHPNATHPKNSLLLMPVIFTTSRLFAGDASPEAVDLSTGNLDPSKFSVKELPYLYYQYHLSPGIKHDYPDQTVTNNLSDLLAMEAIRTIPVVNTSGIGDFLKTLNPEYFDLYTVEGVTVNSLF